MIETEVGGVERVLGPFAGSSRSPLGVVQAARVLAAGR